MFRVLLCVSLFACGSVPASKNDAGADASSQTPDGGTQACDPGWAGAACDECVVYVDGQTTNDAGSGRSWAEAKRDISSGIAVANARILAESLSACSVWVRAGTYHPPSQTEPIELAPKVHLYGGFAGTETARDQRDWDTLPTIISGDLAGNDDNNVPVANQTTRGDNAHRLLVGANDTALDGFVITGGQAPNLERAAGLYLSGASIRIENCTFSYHGAHDGPAISAHEGTTLRIANTTFVGNYGTGGGTVVLSDSTATMSHVTFRDNDLYIGTGVQVKVNASAVITNAVFENNVAHCCGGAVTVEYPTGSATITTALMRGNRALNLGDAGGGAIEVRAGTATLKNVTIYGNTDMHDASISSQLYIRGTLALHNSIVWGGSKAVLLTGGGTASIRHSLVEGGMPSGVTDFADSSGANPLFVEPPMNLRLLPNSPAIDTGNTQLTDLTTHDIAGLPRIVDGDGDGTAAIDRGAYEYQ